jgi:uncharacterized protein (DUF1330 family)
MTAYVIAIVDVQNPERYADYIKLTPGTIAPYGGRFIARGGRYEKLEGEMAANRVVMLEFDTYEQAKAWYDCESYAAARAIRQSASAASLFLVEGVKP